MPSAGRAADLFGPKRILMIGLTVFTVALAACGLTPNASLLFAARAVQGFGAALVTPSALALIMIHFKEGDARNHALGIWGAVASAGGIAGNLIGGLLTDLAGWRWIFLANVPIGAVVLVLTSRAVRANATTRTRIDLPEAVLLTVGMVALMAAMSQASATARIPWCSASPPPACCCSLPSSWWNCA